MISITLVIYTVLALILVNLWKWYSAHKTFLSKFANVPGPKGWPIVGSGLDFKNPADVLPILMQYKEKYGLSFRLQLGPHNYIFTSDPKLIEFVTTSQTQIKKSVNYKFLHRWLGTGLLTAANPKWKRQRRLLTPSFHFKILESCLPFFVENAQNLVTHFRKSIGKEIDVHEDVVLCSLDIICESIMGTSVNALQDGSSSEYARCVKYMTKTVVERTFSPWKQFDLLYILSPAYSQEVKSVKFLHDVTDRMIRSKRGKLNQSKQSAINKPEINEGADEGVYGKKKLSFIDVLLTSSTEEGGTLSDYDIRQEVDAFMFAGHDTVSSAISFTLCLLSKHQGIQEKIWAEIQQAHGTSNEITFDFLNKLNYLEMVIKETMRLYPPVPMIARTLTEDIVHQGQVYPKGLIIAVFPFGVHRVPEIYQEPEKFDPERFTPVNCAQRSTFGYIPFSAGPRNCIGQKFAMLEMKTVLSLLLAEYKLLEVPSCKIEPVSETVLKSKNGLWVRLEKR